MSPGCSFAIFICDAGQFCKITETLSDLLIPSAQVNLHRSCYLIMFSCFADLFLVQSVVVSRAERSDLVPFESVSETAKKRLPCLACGFQFDATANAQSFVTFTTTEDEADCDCGYDAIKSTTWCSDTPLWLDTYVIVWLSAVCLSAVCFLNAWRSHHQC